MYGPVGRGPHTSGEVFLSVAQVPNVLQAGRFIRMHVPVAGSGQGAVIFVSRRNASDAAGYAAAAAAMEARAAVQPGFRGIDSARGVDGLGITVSWWADEAAALAWRADAEHAAIREAGRALWYDRYAVAVADVSRSYDWVRP